MRKDGGGSIEVDRSLMPPRPLGSTMLLKRIRLNAPIRFRKRMFGGSVSWLVYIGFRGSFTHAVALISNNVTDERDSF